MPVKVWIQAARLRTLPLAIAGTITGNLLAYAETGRYFNTRVFILSILTATFLQILGNYANDYGDFKNGADTAERTDRVMASGLITEQKMRVAIAMLALLCLLSGISLLYISFHGFRDLFWLFLALGVAGILAAYFYTAGKKPYGYIGLGDISVFIFFGLVSVGGTYFLQVHKYYSPVWLVGCAIGFLSVGVLNINNIRDIESDIIKHKRTIATRLGYYKAMAYQRYLVAAALACLITYEYKMHSPLLLLNLILFTVSLMAHVTSLRKAKARVEFNKQLKFLSLLTLFLSLYLCCFEILVNYFRG